MARRPQGWHIEDIKAALRKRYGSLARLSTEWGLARAAISNALSKPNESIPTERRIAQALDVAPHALWPDRWSPNGDPLPRSIGKQPNSVAKPAHRQSERAA